MDELNPSLVSAPTTNRSREMMGGRPCRVGNKNTRSATRAHAHGVDESQLCRGSAEDEREREREREEGRNFGKWRVTYV